MLDAQRHYTAKSSRKKVIDDIQRHCAEQLYYVYTKLFSLYGQWTKDVMPDSIHLAAPRDCIQTKRRREPWRLGSFVSHRCQSFFDSVPGDMVAARDSEGDGDLEYSGTVVDETREENPDTGAYEIVYRVKRVDEQYSDAKDLN